MGDLYLATHKTLGGKWAVKVLAENLAKEPSVVERFVNEAKIEANLQHPNIVKVFHIGQSGPYHYFVMNYIDGEDLAERLERCGPLSESESVSIAFQICRALECAHDHNICHRDLKPSNVRLDRYGTVCVLDFGIARARDALISSRTIEGERLGTPLYMSPEQIKGLPVDAKSDLYSLGVLIYEMLTGINPFQADSAHAVYSKHLHHVPQAPIELNPRIRPALSDLVMQLLEKEADKRIQSARELCVLLRPFRETTEVTPSISQRDLASPGTAAYKERLTHLMVRIPETVISRELSPEETKVLNLTDGTRTVGEILALSQLEKDPFFAALDSLKGEVVIQTMAGSEEEAFGQGFRTGMERLLDKLPMERRWVYVSLSAVALCMVLAIAYWISPYNKKSIAVHSGIQFDASPFASVTVRDQKGTVIVEKRVTPFLLNLAAGEYRAEFEHDSEKKDRSFRIEASKPLSVVREDFWTEQDTRNLIDNSLK